MLFGTADQRQSQQSWQWWRYLSTLSSTWLLKKNVKQQTHLDVTLVHFLEKCSNAVLKLVAMHQEELRLTRCNESRNFPLFEGINFIVVASQHPEVPQQQRTWRVGQKMVETKSNVCNNTTQQPGSLLSIWQQKLILDHVNRGVQDVVFLVLDQLGLRQQQNKCTPAWASFARIASLKEKCAEVQVPAHWSSQNTSHERESQCCWEPWIQRPLPWYRAALVNDAKVQDWLTRWQRLLLDLALLSWRWVLLHTNNLHLQVKIKMRLLLAEKGKVLTGYPARPRGLVILILQPLPWGHITKGRSGDNSERVKQCRPRLELESGRETTERRWRKKEKIEHEKTDGSMSWSAEIPDSQARRGRDSYWLQRLTSFVGVDGPLELCCLSCWGVVDKQQSIQQHMWHSDLGYRYWYCIHPSCMESSGRLQYRYRYSIPVQCTGTGIVLEEGVRSTYCNIACYENSSTYTCTYSSIYTRVSGVDIAIIDTGSMLPRYPNNIIMLQYSILFQYFNIWHEIFRNIVAIKYCTIALWWVYTCTLYTCTYRYTCTYSSKYWILQ